MGSQASDALDRPSREASAVTDRMPGRYAQPWCPICHAPSGPDCPDRSRTPKQTRARLKRELAADPSRHLAEETTP